MTLKRDASPWGRLPPFDNAPSRPAARSFADGSRAGEGIRRLRVLCVLVEEGPPRPFGSKTRWPAPTVLREKRVAGGFKGRRKGRTRAVWVETSVVDKLSALRGPGEELQRRHPAACGA